MIKRFVFGGSLVVLGVLFFLSNLNYIPHDLGEIFTTYWPVVLILWGLNEFGDHLFKRRGGLSNYFFPTLLITIGSVLLGNKLDIFPNGDINLWKAFWPLVIIFIGLSFLLPSHWKKHKVYVNRGYHHSEKKYKTWMDFSGGDKNVFLGSLDMGREPWVLEDSSYSVGVGEAKIDLTKAFIKEGETNLSISGFTGSIVLIIPDDVAVDIQASLDLGEVTIFHESHSGTPSLVTYKSENYDTAFKKLLINVKLNVGEIVIKQVN